MVTENDVLPIEKPRKLHFEWVIPAVFRPRRTLEQATDSTQGTWLTPLLILTLLALVVVVVAGPIQQAANANGGQNLPPDFQYWSPEQQSQYRQTLSASSGPFFTYGLPALSALFRVWIGWFLLAAVLHLALTLGGSRTNMTFALNLVGWASLPNAIRSLVQIGGMLATHQIITNPGLAGFAPEGTGFLIRYVGAILPLIDIYLLWMVVLIVVGVRSLAGMSAKKEWGVILITMVIFLLLVALPKFIGAQLGALNTGGNRFFFF